MPPGPVLRRVFLVPNALYRRRLGWVLGHRFLQLTHRGRRSGRRFQTVLEVVHYDRGTGAAIVAAGYGPSADWYRNLCTASAEAVTIGRTTFVPEQRFLSTDEAAEVLADYERRSRFAAPMVRWMLGRLVGLVYDGTPDGRRQVAEALPMVELRPRA